MNQFDYIESGFKSNWFSFDGYIGPVLNRIDYIESGLIDSIS